MSINDHEEMALICEHISREERPVRLVFRHRDHSWQMMCGDTDHDPEGTGCAVVHPRHIFDRQPDLEELVQLEPGMMADWINQRCDIAYHDD